MQNKELKLKLCETTSSPLMECSTNTFLGTGWNLDSIEWLKLLNYPGKNVLGKLLMEVRETVSTPTSPADLFYSSNRWDVIDAYQPATAPALVGVSTITRAPSGSQGSLISKSTESLSSGSNIDGASVEEQAHKQVNTHAPTSTVTSASVSTNDGDGGKTRERCGIYEESQSQTTSSSSRETKECAGAEAAVGETGDTLDLSNSKGALMEVEEADATSFSYDSDLLRSSFSAKSVTTEDDYLDCDKMMSWALPTVNISRLRDIASSSNLSLKSGTQKGAKRLLQNNTALVHSASVSHVTRRKSRKQSTEVMSSEQQKMEEKWKLLQMLSKFNNNE